jgi:quercetin dioxygenase-like cupin family protein
MLRLFALWCLLSVRPSEVQWKDGPPGLPKGSKFAVLEGGPAQAGYFSMRLKFPAGFRIPPHTHPQPERLTVIEGTYLVGQGSKVDDAAMSEWPAGSYITTPAGTPHYTLAKTDVVIQLTTVGPWGIHFLDGGTPAAK